MLNGQLHFASALFFICFFALEIVSDQRAYPHIGVVPAFLAHCVSKRTLLPEHFQIPLSTLSTRSELAHILYRIDTCRIWMCFRNMTHVDLQYVVFHWIIEWLSGDSLNY